MFPFLPSHQLFVQFHAAAGGAAPVVIDFQVVPQKYSQWCWAAVTSSVSRHYDKSSTWTQCAVATAELNKPCCTPDSEQCNRWWYLDRALSRTNNQRDFVQNTVSVTDTMRELMSNRPVGIRVQWGDGSGHFLVIRGWHQDSSGNDYFVLTDPIYGDSSYAVADLVNGAYQNGQGFWTHTYLTKPSK